MEMGYHILSQLFISLSKPIKIFQNLYQNYPIDLPRISHRNVSPQETTEAAPPEPAGTSLAHFLARSALEDALVPWMLKEDTLMIDTGKTRWLRIIIDGQENHR